MCKNKKGKKSFGKVKGCPLDEWMGGVDLFFFL